MSDTDETLARVRKLLALAERTDNEAERDAFNERAAQLIAKYGIDQAMLAAAAEQTGLPLIVGDKMIVVHAPYQLDKAVLLATIATACRVKHVRIRRNGKVSLHMFGFAADLERVEILYTSLLVQVSLGLATSRPNAWAGESVAAYRRSWLAGFTVAVRVRLEQAEQAAQDDAGVPGVALVLRNRDRAVAGALSAAYPSVRPAPARRLSGSGYARGHAAGQRADLGSARGKLAG